MMKIFRKWKYFEKSRKIWKFRKFWGYWNFEKYRFYWEKRYPCRYQKVICVEQNVSSLSHCLHYPHHWLQPLCRGIKNNVFFLPQSSSLRRSFRRLEGPKRRLSGGARWAYKHLQAFSHRFRTHTVLTSCVTACSSPLYGTFALNLSMISAYVLRAGGEDRNFRCVNSNCEREINGGF